MSDIKDHFVLAAQAAIKAYEWEFDEFTHSKGGTCITLTRGLSVAQECKLLGPHERAHCWALAYESVTGRCFLSLFQTGYIEGDLKLIAELMAHTNMTMTDAYMAAHEFERV
jgi:hypothetical protein